MIHDPSTLLGLLFRGHPWHGVPIGAKAPDVVTCFIEIVPTDRVKYEIDKATGYLKVDRPQLYSNICPAPYGFIPQTYCGPRVGAYSANRTNRPSLKGDGLYGGWWELADVPEAVANRLTHYFETYKLAPGATTKPVEITHLFGRDEAHAVIRCAQDDYSDKFGVLQKQLADALA